jgi:hypothetical protein
MKRTLPSIVLILAVLACTECSLSNESSFFSGFSLQKLVERNKSRAGLVCDSGGGSGDSIFSVSGGKGFRSHKGDEFTCYMKSDAVNHVDASTLSAGLRQDVEKAIVDSGAIIVETGNPTASSFYVRYTFAHAEGRVEISARRVRDNYYSFNADLDEGSTGRSK